MRSLRENNFGFKALNRLSGGGGGGGLGSRIHQGGVRLKNLGGEFADVIFPTL